MWDVVFAAERGGGGIVVSIFSSVGDAGAVVRTPKPKLPVASIVDVQVAERTRAATGNYRTLVSSAACRDRRRTFLATFAGVAPRSSQEM